MRNFNAVITGVGGYVPEKIVTNEDICKMVDTSDEWITTRTGIKERRKLEGKHAGASIMGANAVMDLIMKSGVNPEEIDAIICSTSTPDYLFPATAVLIAEKCGIKNAFGYDLSAACSGFIFAMVNGVGLVESGRYKKVLVVATEKMTQLTNYEDRSTCPLFGDGAAAVLLEPTTEDVGVMDFDMHSDATGYSHLILKGGGSVNPTSHETISRREHYVYQDGQFVFKLAVNSMVEACKTMMERNNISPEQLAWVVPHQANMRIIDAIVRNLNIPLEKVMVNIPKYGNTSSATVPICLWEWEKQLKKGDILILAAFGAGFSWGGMCLKWGYDPK